MTLAAVNQTAGPCGLTPTLLNFEVIMRMPIIRLKLPTHAHSNALVTAREERVARVARTSIRAALSTSALAAADLDVHPEA